MKFFRNIKVLWSLIAILFVSILFIIDILRVEFESGICLKYMDITKLNVENKTNDW